MEWSIFGFIPLTATEEHIKTFQETTVWNDIRANAAAVLESTHLAMEIPPDVREENDSGDDWYRGLIYGLRLVAKIPEDMIECKQEEVEEAKANEKENNDV